MPDKLEKLIKLVYKNWKMQQPKIEEPHPDEEALVCFFEGKLSSGENEQIKAHLIKCNNCAERFILQANLKISENKPVPEELLERIKNLLVKQGETPVLEIFLKLKEKALEIISTTGDILVGQELVPAPVFRSRKIKDFKDEVTILKDFKDFRVEIKIENKSGKVFDLTVMAKEKETQKIIKDLRITLLKDDLELESYLNETGSVTFENVLLGKYTVTISNSESKLASILLDIKT